MFHECFLQVSCMFPAGFLHVPCRLPACVLEVSCVFPACFLQVSCRCRFLVCSLEVSCRKKNRRSEQQFEKYLCCPIPNHLNIETHVVKIVENQKLHYSVFWNMLPFIPKNDIEHFLEHPNMQLKYDAIPN